MRNKTVLITGASTGIGRATAFFFQKKGWNVAATMRNPEKENDLMQLNHTICPRLDVLDRRSIKASIAETLQHFQQIDAIVNNAGYALVGPFEIASEEQIQRQFDTNVFGLMNVIKEILPYFREQKKGAIVNVVSVGGRVAFPFYSLYNSTKWAVEGFSESLQHELRPFNIKVKIIEPGPIKTDFYHRSMDVVCDTKIEDYDRYLNRALPNMLKAGKIGASPQRVARVIYHAASRDNWRLRYPAGAGAGLMLFFRRILPDRLYNWVARRVTYI